MRFTPLLALLIALPAGAQDIPAQAAVGQCYSACATTLYAANFRTELSITSDRQRYWWKEITWGEYKTYTCSNIQNLVTEADICHAGCRDVEAAYGSVNSQAENIFVLVLDQEIGPILATGLHTDDYRSRPILGTPQFTLACNRLFGEVAGAQSSSITKLLGQVEQQQAKSEPEALVQP